MQPFILGSAKVHVVPEAQAPCSFANALEQLFWLLYRTCTYIEHLIYNYNIYCNV